MVDGFMPRSRNRARDETKPDVAVRPGPRLSFALAARLRKWRLPAILCLIACALGLLWAALIGVFDRSAPLGPPKPMAVPSSGDLPAPFPVPDLHAPPEKAPPPPVPVTPEPQPSNAPPASAEPAPMPPVQQPSTTEPPRPSVPAETDLKPRAPTPDEPRAHLRRPRRPMRVVPAAPPQRQLIRPAPQQSAPRPPRQIRARQKQPTERREVTRVAPVTQPAARRFTLPQGLLPSE